MNYKDEDYGYPFRKQEGELIILRLDKNIKSFYVGFIKLNYYNRLDASAHARYPYIKDTQHYEPVLIPYFID